MGRDEGPIRDPKDIAKEKVAQLKTDVKQISDILDGLNNALKKVDTNKGISVKDSRVDMLEKLVETIKEKSGILVHTINTMDITAQKENKEIQDKINIIALDITQQQQFKDFKVVMIRTGFTINLITGFGWAKRQKQVAEFFVVKTNDNKLFIKLAILEDKKLDYLKSRLILSIQEVFKQNPYLMEGRSSTTEMTSISIQPAGVDN